MRGLFTVGLLVSVFVKKCAAEYWTYESLDEWPETCQNGTEQSPINIETNSTTRTTFPEIEFYNYYNASMVLQNTGHTVELRISEDTRSSLWPYLTGGPLGSDDYVLDNFHFHWNSEHRIDGSSYPLEGHFLHFKSKLGNLSNAMNYINGFAVLAVMYTVEDRCGNNSFDDILAKIEDVSRNVGVSIELSKTININGLFPPDPNKYFVYNGSFTTPDCNEGALWTVLEEPSCISHSQLEKLSDIYTSENHTVTNNNRPVQDLNEREVLYNSGTASDTAKKKYLSYYCIILVYLLYNNYDFINVV